MRKNTAVTLKFIINEIEKGTIILNDDLYLKYNFIKHIRPDISHIVNSINKIIAMFLIMMIYIQKLILL